MKVTYTIMDFLEELIHLNCQYNKEQYKINEEISKNICLFTLSSSYILPFYKKRTEKTMRLLCEKKKILNIGDIQPSL